MVSSRPASPSRVAPLSIASDARVNPWNVVHACERVRDVADIRESQLSVGMRPIVLTPTEVGILCDPGKKPESLLKAWNHVRRWRKSITEIESNYDLVHAHSFAAGMASVRSTAATVYDVRAFVDQIANSDGRCEPNSWLARSFRVAEYFVLTRASVVVVHTPYQKKACLERGISVECVFEVPDPISLEDRPPVIPKNAIFTIVAPDVGCGDDIAQTVNLLSAFQQLQAESERLRLVVAPEEKNELVLRQTSARLGLRDSVNIVSLNSNGFAEWFAQADIIVAGVRARGSAHLEFADALPSSTSLAAMVAARPLLAADAAQTRNISPEGRGLLWYSIDSPHELAAQLVHLMRSEDLRGALAREGFEYIKQTRSPARVGGIYDQVYRFAVQRRRDRESPNAKIPLQPAYGQL